MDIFHRLKNSYYSKIMVICIAAVSAITMLLLPICNSLIHRQERTEYLKNYDLTLSALSSSALSRQDTLAASLSPLFSDAKKYKSLCSLYRYPSKKVPTQYSSDVLDILSSLCNSDTYCLGALLLTRTGHLFQYDIRYEALVPLSLKQTTKRLTPYQLQTLTDMQLEDISNDFQKPADHVYGLCTSIFDPDADTVEYLGTLILLYSTAEFSNIVTNALVDSKSTFSILDQDQNILFSSSNQYDSSDELLLNTNSSRDSYAYQATASQKDLNDKPYYTSTLYNDRFHFYTAYQLPTTVFSYSYIQVILNVISIIICLTAILLYVIAFRISDRKINTIRKGMKLIGKNNLTYRLPIPKENDEFTQIILSFNSMCEALERNVEKAYLHEIFQRKAELYAMQTSINPHFLYNSLEQIRVQIVKDCYSDASQMLLLLSKMYRNQTRRNLYISIAEECSQSENLINFYMYRFGDFEYEFNIHSSIKIYGIPKNTIQPLIENYFVHGYIPDSDDNLLTISAMPFKREEKIWIQFKVEDNGSSITSEKLCLLKEKLSKPVMSQNEDNGFALSNVNFRLKLVYGEDSCLIPSIGENGTGFCISFSIPALLLEDLQKT